MEKDLIKIFNKAKYVENENLVESIWQKIILRNKRIIRVKIFMFSLLGITSIIGIIPAFKAMLSDLTQSGVYEYVSLAFSNNGVIFSYWKEILLSVAEALPVMSIILSLSLVFVLFLSLKNATKEIIKGQLSLSF